jgi:hypothetical protein
MDAWLPSSQQSTFFSERQIELKTIQRRTNMKASFALKRIGRLAPAFALIATLCASTTAQAQPLITCNQFGLGGQSINTYDFSTGAIVGSFIPTGATGNGNGRGVEVLGNNIYYTELNFTPPGFFGPTNSIEIAPFNGGAGGADVRTIPNPRPTTGIQDLAYFNGVLYILTGYPLDPPEVFGLNPFDGAVVIGPISISAPASTDSDGFTVLPNGNFLINEGDDLNAYDQYDPTTGAVVVGTSIVAPGNPFATGVDTDGTSLFFHTNSDIDFTSNSLAQTTVTGAPIATQGIPADFCEDISIPQSVCFGVAGATPGKSNCHGKCISFLAKADGGVKKASTDLGYASVKDLQNAVKAFCGK